SETGRTFAATEHADSAIRPKLIVRYQLNANTTPPVASDSSADGVEDIPFGENLAVTDTSGLPLLYSVKNSPAHGMLSVEDATGHFTYTPFTDFHGTDSFTFTASNDNGESNTATVTLTITPVNDSPAASAASFTTDEDLSISGWLNATDIDGDTLNFTLVTAPSKGTVTLNATGTFTYQPDDDISGTDSFTYKVNDDSADSNTATVTITINPTNDAPITQNSSISVDEDASVSGQLTATDVDGDTLNYIQVSTAARGVLTLNTNGSFTYSPNVNVSGTDSFTFKVNDGAADSNTATVNITINPINDTPTADNTSLTANAGATVTGQLIAGDVDGDSLSYSLTGTPTKGSALVNANGSFTYTANGDAAGTDSFSFKVNDGTADSNTATVTITINQVNDAPVAQNSSLSLDAGSSINGQLLANDSDNDPLNFLLVTSPEQGSITLNANGSFTYTANSDTEGTDSFSFKVNDGVLDSNIATVTITINPAELRFELGELQVSSEWQQVLFTEPFITPVVITKAASVNDIEPGVVRVKNVTETGFEVRFQEWDALDGEHPAETVTFMVMEQGRFSLDDGTGIEAGCFSTANTAGFSRISFSQSMNAVPVVMAAVTSENEIDAVTMRIGNITTGGFEQKMQEQESNATDHSTESACYIAWEPSTGQFNNMNYEVATTPNEVTDSGYTIHYSQIFTEAPILLASMQSTNGGDTATLRSNASRVDSVEVRVSEEQSLDSETSHVAETAGYIAFGNLDLTSDSDNDGLLTSDEINTYTTHPGLADTDNDGLMDGEEVAYWQDRGIDWAGDIDNDGIINLIDGDADGDGILDGVEVAAGFDPADPASAPAFPLLDAGEIDVDHNWVHVQLVTSFVHPVVVAKLISSNDPEPCVVRIANTTVNGFDIRVQEYDYQDDIHAVEQVSFIVMEAGSYTLSDGTRIEAASFPTNATRTYEVYGFAQTFQEVPVVITAVSSYNEEDTVTGRMRKISTTGFDYKMQEQEANKQAHLQETISYIAWEPSTGSELGISYEVGRSGDVVTHLPSTVAYTSRFNQAPLLLTDMQTNDGGNTASLRLLNNTPSEMQIFVQEEQSKDEEISHTTEVAGFITIQPK
ncbi:MAG: tandem-95 repeat protein, partial [Desulfobulbaceae bacterium]|nr:tandem-95 repeat protein [Desulfobulbaceae bacterium]